MFPSVTELSSFLFNFPIHTLAVGRGRREAAGGYRPTERGRMTYAHSNLFKGHWNSKKTSSPGGGQRRPGGSGSAVNCSGIKVYGSQARK